MDGRTADALTRTALVVTVVAVIGLMVPLIGLAAALIALVLAGVAWRRARADDRANPLARNCVFINSAIIVLLVVGNLVYSAAN